MRFSLLAGFLSCFLAVSSRASLLDHESTFSGTTVPCHGCASVERLRSSAFGIEMAPDHFTFAMKFSNGTVAPLVRIRPTSMYRLFVTWMRESIRSWCKNPQLSMGALGDRVVYVEIVRAELDRLLTEVDTFYPGLELDYGGFAIPDYIYRDNLTRTVVEEAINKTTFWHPENKPVYRLYPTDFAVIADTTVDKRNADTTLDDWTSPDANFDFFNTENVHFHALVVTNTTSFLSVTWYHFSVRQNAIGHFVTSRLDVPYLKTMRRFPLPSEKPLNGLQPDLSPLRTYVAMKELEHKGRPGFGTGSLSMNSRLILRLSATSDEDVHLFGKELYAMLRNTRFSPALKSTTVIRDEVDEEDWMWTPALYVATDMKKTMDAPTPKGCVGEHQACKELRDCVHREARGELVICEDVTPPSPSIFERIEDMAQEGTWAFVFDHFLGWASDLANEVEARLWLLYCRADMPWSTPSSAAYCSGFVVPVDDEHDGVLESQLALTESLLHSVAEYWIGAGTLAALLPVPLYWIGEENALKMVFWTLSRILGPDVYNQTIVGLQEWWEVEMGPITGPLLGDWSGINSIRP